MHAGVKGDQEHAWLEVGSATQSASRLSGVALGTLDITTEVAAVLAVRAGVVPRVGSDLERLMIQAVLDGQCSDVGSVTPSLATDLLRVLAPQHHLRRASEDEQAYRADVGHLDSAIADYQRQAAFKRLKGNDKRSEHLQQALRVSKGQAGTTSQWGNSARALAGIYGPCWLAAEIAVIGAALPPDRFTTGGDTTNNSRPFGGAADYGRLLQAVRLNRGKPEWWVSQYETNDDPLSRATWAMALVAAASRDVVLTNLERLGAATRRLPGSRLEALLSSSSRLGASGMARRLDPEVLGAAAAVSPIVGLLVAHHVASLDLLADLPQFSEQQLADLSKFGVSAWPALRALTARMITGPSSSLLAAIRLYGTSAKLPLENWPLREAHARLILDECAEYPLAWVLAAEQQVSRNAGGEPLERVAEREQWFDH